MKKSDLTNEYLITAKSVIYYTFWNILSSRFECREPFIEKYQKILSEIVILSIILSDTGTVHIDLGREYALVGQLVKLNN